MPGSPPIQVFVAYDFAIGGSLPVYLESVKHDPPPGFAVEWPGEPRGKAQGEIWRDIVHPGIEKCERLLAFVDLHNANVGYEVGYALGKGKQVALARMSSEFPAWTKVPPLKGWMCPHLESVTSILNTIAADDWPQLHKKLQPGRDVLVLCPTVAGEPYLKRVKDSWGWRKLPESGWSLHDLPDQLSGVGLVLWVIAPHHDGPKDRDGKENAALSVIAGYAAAHPELTLRVLAHDNARPVADTLGHSTPFGDLASFERLATNIVQGWREGPPPPAPEVRLRGLAGQLEAAHEELERRTLAGLPVEEVQAEILALKRQLREGDQLHPGDILAGRYRLAEQIGQGGFATVWKAYDRKQQQLVAVKVLHGAKARDASHRERFFRGGEKMAELSHPAIVKVIEPRGQDERSCFLVMEYLDGGDLRAAVRDRKVAPSAVVPLICEIGAGLQHAHDAGLIHRDVKPANIVLDRTGRAKLTDFDLVRAGDTTGGTRTGMMGTFFYAAPECLTQAKDAGPAADVFSLGMTAMFALHGADLPYAAFKRPELFVERFPCAPALKRVLLQAIEEEPAKRFASCEEFCAALREAESGAQPDGPSRVPDAAEPVGLQEVWQQYESQVSRSESQVSRLMMRRPGERAHLSTWLKVGVAFVAVALGVGVWIQTHQQTPEPTPEVTKPAPAPAAPAPSVAPREVTPMVMVKVPGGTFKMGSTDGDDNEKPVHEVTLSPYEIDKTEVTVAQYRECVERGKCESRPWTGENCTWDAAGKEDHPINCVTWDQAVAYCHSQKPLKELPTEAQWEFAARGSKGLRYPWGDEPPDSQLCWNRSSTCPVGLYPSGASPFEALDMAGNVWEWTADWYGPYSGRPEKDPRGPEKGTARVLRGGSWHNNVASGLRGTYRLRFEPWLSLNFVGFRCARGVKNE